MPASAYTTTQIYDKRRRAVKDSTSHKMPL
jgi:hypothetical protein